MAPSTPHDRLEHPQCGYRPVTPSNETFIHDMADPPFDPVTAGLTLEPFKPAGEDIQKARFVVVDDETV